MHKKDVTTGKTYLAINDYIYIHFEFCVGHLLYVFNRGVIITVTFKSKRAVPGSDRRQSRMAGFCMYNQKKEVIHNASFSFFFFFLIEHN